MISFRTFAYCNPQTCRLSLLDKSDDYFILVVNDGWFEIKNVVPGECIYYEYFEKIEDLKTAVEKVKFCLFCSCEKQVKSPILFTGDTCPRCIILETKTKVGRCIICDNTDVKQYSRFCDDIRHATCLPCALKMKKCPLRCGEDATIDPSLPVNGEELRSVLSTFVSAIVSGNNGS